VEEDLDIGLYGDEPEEPLLPKKKVPINGFCFHFQSVEVVAEFRIVDSVFGSKCTKEYIT